MTCHVQTSSTPNLEDEGSDPKNPKVTAAHTAGGWYVSQDICTVEDQKSLFEFASGLYQDDVVPHSIVDIAGEGTTGRPSSSGQKRAVMLPTPSHKLVLDKNNEEGCVVADDDTLMEVRAVLYRVMENLATEANNKGYKVTMNDRVDVEFTFTPVGTQRQDIHVDGPFNHHNNVTPLNPGCNGGTRVPELGQDWKTEEFGNINFVQPNIASGGSLAFDSTMPHGGPGNSGNELRICLFTSFALDETSRSHSTDDLIIFDRTTLNRLRSENQL